ncbi:MAG: hypothetical protein ABFD50_19400 [Smithella sp.]
MWELIYEDTFGFGEDRDPPRIEKKGENGQDGFFQLWTSVLNESLVISNEKPVVGFASFTLRIDLPDENSKKTVTIDVGKYLDLLAKLKQEANPDKIRKIAIEHYQACQKNQEDSFWKNFYHQKKSFKLFALNLSRNAYIKKIITSSLLIILANILFLFCFLSMLHLFSIQEITKAIAAGLFSIIFLSINVSFFNIKSLSMRYKYPEKFYIEIDEKNFIHSDGNFIKKISLNSITDIKETEIFSRGGRQVMIIVDYLDNDKKTTYSFFKAFSKNDVIYDFNTETLKNSLS